ncbi:MAG: GNAT family N-acetyltransferase [Dehalococcoidales bacterium]|nr:GNAT family N-acetyltransferase [Dehalococcoidales bacterium]
MNLKIRPVSASDRTALIKILENTPEFKPSEIIIAKEVLDSCLKDPVNSGYFFLVAEDNNKVAGYICYGPAPLTDGTWDIYWEAVAQGKRGLGIGSSLIKAAEKEIIKSGGRLLLVETSSTAAYAKTRQFYKRHGYSEIARVPDFYEPGDDKLILQKRLR